jgi:hypothetical protein
VRVGILFTALLLILTSAFAACFLVVEGEDALFFYRQNGIIAIGSEMGRIFILQKTMTRWSIGPNFLISKRSFMSAYIILSYKGAFFTFVGNGCGKTYFFLQEGATGLPRAC